METLDIKIVKSTGRIELNKEVCGILLGNEVHSLFPPFWTLEVSSEESKLLGMVLIKSPSFKVIRRNNEELYMRFIAYNSYEILKTSHKIRYIIKEFKKQLIINRMTFILDENQYNKLDEIVEIAEHIPSKLEKHKSSVIILSSKIELPTVDQLIIYPDEGIDKLEKAVYMIKRV